MLEKVLEFFTGNPNQKALDKIQPLVEYINSLEPEYEKLSDEDLQNKSFALREQIQGKTKDLALENLIRDDVPKMPGQIRTNHDKVLQEALEEILPHAFALCREASKRVLKMRHFDVQLIGGIQLHRGGIAEMQTGEGKTLVCTLAAYLNGLSGRGVHVVTVNDYLAARDSKWMGQLYNFLGLSVGLISSGMDQQERKENYACDITYGTNNEFGFDYLRDNMETDLDDCVQRPYFMAIVDEVDSILIDEARTPLIISGMPDARKNEIYQIMAKLVKQLSRTKDEKDNSSNAHYYVDEKARNVILTESGINKAEELLKVDDLWDPEYNLAHHLLNALKAKELFVKDTDYIVKKGEESGRKEVIIVDEFTGRLMEGRRWGDGLHQAVEAKEGVQIQEETLTMASITFQNLFRLYPKLSGMTGTAMTEAEEFEKIYNLGALQIPTNKPNQRQDHNDVVYKTELAKYTAIAEDIVEAHLKASPVLVGTTSIEKSEYLASLISKPQFFLQVLQFRLKRLLEHYEKTGNQISMEAKKILDRPGNLDSAKLKIVLDEIKAKIPKPNEDQEFAITSLEKAALTLDAIRKGIKVSVLNAKQHKQEAQIVREAGRPGAVTIATNMAGRGTDIILGGHLSSDPKNSDYNIVDMEAQAQVKESGGLFVMGCERHESRRIDNQLRGRAARQGDPGQSKFYLSLEDNLMRIFGGERVMAVMDMLKADEDLPIEANIISGAINNSQKKVEAHNFDIRKHVLQYDDVANTQREVIYRERRQILEGNDIHENILAMIDKHIDAVLYANINPNLPSELWYADSNGPSPMTKIFEQIKSDLGEEILAQVEDINSFAEKGFDALQHQIKEAALAHFKSKEEALGPEVLREAERQIMLHVIDSKWVEHLHAMDSLKEGIHLQGYGQKDPLIEYKKESFDMFDNLLELIKRDTVILLFHSQVVKKTEKITS